MELDLLLLRESLRRQTAIYILSKLQLLERWQPYGRPYVVGAVAYDLVVSPDIDLEIFCPDTPRVEAGFAVMALCARHPSVRIVRYSNHLDDEHQGYYWQLRYLHHDGVEWKIDMWSMRHDHPGPLSRDLIEPMRRRLTAETRGVILEIKEKMLLQPEQRCPSICIYQAVIEGGVCTLDDLRDWRSAHPDGLNAWKPG